VARNYVRNPKKLRALERAIGKPVKWALTNGGLGHGVLAIASDGEEFRVSAGVAAATGERWTPHDDGHWSRTN
jgi:hypothetical protein